MSEAPTIAAKKPIAVEVKEGEDYYWCACGKSKTQPFCDGSHRGTSFTPLKYTADKTETKYFCQCKHTKNKPMCDGSHRNLPDVTSAASPSSSSSAEEPTIAAKKPIAVEVKEGEDYYWCACGKSKTQPFCDGSHRGTSFTPLKYTADKTETKYFCQCKHTKNKPMCDGSHRNLGEKKVPDIEDLVKPSGVSSAGGKVNTSEFDFAEPTPEEPTLAYIKSLARDGLKGEHGEVDAMGVPGPTLPQWKDIQILPAQMAQKPLLDHSPVGTELVIGPRAKKPLVLKIPLFVSDMSFGALSQNAKVALARGAELAGTGICSGEGGMLPEEQEANSRYFYELASAKFGYDENLLKRVQAFHFKGGQGAKTGTGGHLPGKKVTEKIASVRKLKVGQDAISPATFIDLVTADDFRRFADHVREITGGIPIGFKLSANHIEDDIDFALEASADYIILDGRGGATGAAPLIFRNNISVPTIAALARARKHLDRRGADHVTLIITGGLRTPDDFIKALCLGADGVAVSNAALQSIGCVAARMCHTNLCPAGVATQDPSLAAKLDVEKSAKQLCNFFTASTQLMQVMARACGHNHISLFNQYDITTWKLQMAELTGIQFGGVGISRHAYDENRAAQNRLSEDNSSTLRSSSTSNPLVIGVASLIGAFLGALLAKRA